MTLAPDPLSVPCPACLAPRGTPCGLPDAGAHTDRNDAARHANVEWGTCGLCSQPMARLRDPDDALHPAPDDAAACPPIPDPNVVGWNAYAEVVNAGVTPGRPGLEYFVPADLLEEGRQLASQRDDLIAQGVDPADLAVPLAPALAAGPWCPECAQGKPQNCAQQALLYGELVPCANAREQ